MLIANCIKMSSKHLKGYYRGRVRCYGEREGKTELLWQVLTPTYWHTANDAVIDAIKEKEYLRQQVK